MGLLSRLKDFFRSLFSRKKEPVYRQESYPEREVPPSPERICFHNVIFRDPFGNPGLTHEIDRIIVQRNGLFVIEDKDWRGDIYAYSEDQWLQVLGRGDIRHLHPSPIRQNETHRAVLEGILDDQEENYVIPVVVMKENNCPSGVYPQAINRRDLEKFLQSHSSFDPELSEEEFQDLCAVIREQDCSSTVSIEQHVRNIRRNHPRG